MRRDGPGTGIEVASHPCVMRRQGAQRTVFAFGVAVMVCFALATISFAYTLQKEEPRDPLTVKYGQVIAVFQERAEEYEKLREKMEAKLPKLKKEASAEEIEKHETALQELVRTARAGAKPGDVFVPQMAEYIRATIRDEFKGKERQELRKTVLEADTKGVPLRVNYPYPEAKEFAEVPPTLLLRLPELPKHLKYRFARRHMLLVDSENGLILDYLIDILP